MIRGMSTQQLAPVHTSVPSPVGPLTLVRRGAQLIGVYYEEQWYLPNRASFGEPADHGFDEAVDQLEEYFRGDRRAFDLPLQLEGTTQQRRVWKLIQQVPYGETASYGELARLLADGTDPRDVGGMVGRNPIGIIVPCHRIVGSTGKLTGYAGGLDRKQFLLDLEAPAGRLF